MKRMFGITTPRLLSAIRWALWVNGTFRGRLPGEGEFWWREELRKRAGLVWNGRTYVGPEKNGKR